MTELNIKKRVLAGLKKKWQRKWGDYAGFAVYVSKWMKKFSIANDRKRDKLMALQACSCFYCKRTMALGKGTSKSKRPTIDHKILQSKGGTYSLRNLVLACKECNNLRGDMPFEEFRDMMKELSFNGTRAKIIRDRSKVKAANDIIRKENSKRRKAETVWNLAVLMYCLDRIEKPWYPGSIVDAQNAAKEAMKRDRRILEPA